MWCVGSVAASSGEAEALEPFKIRRKPVALDITNTFVFNYMLDNRNGAPFRPSTNVDDFRAEWIDRLNIQASWWKLRFGLRLDTAVYADELQRGEVIPKAKAEIDAAEARGEQAPSVKDYANQYYRELHSRFVQTFYPSKLFVSYQQPGLEATLGDFYVQLGRGLVFSVRKIDELAIDTTVRGGKVVFDRKLGPLTVGATAFAGQMNPLRIDEVSGRRLHGEASPLFFAFPETGPLKTYEYDPNGQPVAALSRARASYLADTVMGARLEAGPSDWFVLGANLSTVVRRDNSADRLTCLGGSEARCAALPAGSYEYNSCVAAQADLCESRFPVYQTTNPSLLHNQVRTFSGTLSVPSIGKGIADAYVEVAGQQLTDGRTSAIDAAGKRATEADRWGYGIYANANVRMGPVSAAFEFKHYRSFFPLTANIDTVTPGFGAPEFQLVGYNQVPTVEPIYIDPIGLPNICNTGGRARVDAALSKDLTFTGWVGHYVSFSEVNEINFDCKESTQTPEQQAAQGFRADNRTNMWDMASGLDWHFENGRSHLKATFGARLDNLEVPRLAGGTGSSETDVFYKEAYLRYDFVKHLAGKVALQLVGWHRNRARPLTFADPWQEGENYTAIQWAPYLSASFGFEYLNRVGCQPGSDQVPCLFFNGQIQYRAPGNDKMIDKVFNSVRLYVGQRRGALRCVSGVCRLFPPLEGAQVEVVSRF
jgi:hypothetical protein